MKRFIRIINTMVYDVIRFIIIYFPGSTGRRVRYFYYKKKFKSCGKNVLIDEGVIIHDPEWITIGDNVWISKYCILIAGPLNPNRKILKIIKNENFKGKNGELILENGIHIGNYNILQAHGGIHICNNVTTSSGVKIYSSSNCPLDDNNPEMVTYANCMVNELDKVPYIISPIVIEEGGWIALDGIVLGGTIGKYSFIISNSMVLRDIPKNSIASGSPAKRIRERFKLKESDG